MAGPPKTPTPTGPPSTPSPRPGSVSSSRPGSAHYNSGDGYSTSVTPVSIGSNGFIQGGSSKQRIPTPTPIRGSPSVMDGKFQTRLQCHIICTIFFFFSFIMRIFFYKDVSFYGLGLGLNAPRTDSPTNKQWQSKISSIFERTFCFASEQRRKSTEANSSISPGRSGPNSTTPSSSISKCSEVMERPKTPSGNVDCTTSPDSGIGKDLPPAMLEGWIGPVTDRDPLALGSLNGPEHSGSHKHGLHRRSMQKDREYMNDMGKGKP